MFKREQEQGVTSAPHTFSHFSDDSVKFSPLRVVHTLIFPQPI